MRSNVRLRSNVFPSGHLGLHLQVRGRPALKKLLQRLGPGRSESDGARILNLKPRQVAELAWEIPCSQAPYRKVRFCADQQKRSSSDALLVSARTHSPKVVSSALTLRW